MIIKEIGSKNDTIAYTDRPTVKVVIFNGDTVLLLNDGLLPGGGIDGDETDLEAIERELLEELGASVSNIEPIGTVIQYRNFLKKRYVIKGFTATLSSMSGETAPQDEGEAQFSYNWYEKNVAISKVEESISNYDSVNINDDSTQGKLFNLKTSLELLSSI